MCKKDHRNRNKIQSNLILVFHEIETLYYFWKIIEESQSLPILALFCYFAKSQPTLWFSITSTSNRIIQQPKNGKLLHQFFDSLNNEVSHLLFEIYFFLRLDYLEMNFILDLEWLTSYFILFDCFTRSFKIKMLNNFF